MSKALKKAALARFAFPRDKSATRLVNIIRNEWEFRSGKVKLKSIPYVLFLDVACACTLKCPLCYIGQRKRGRPRGMMGMDTFCKAVDDFRDHAIAAHLYIRGEPLMNKLLPEMVAYADNARLMTSISTHLNMFDERTAERLIESGLKKIVISLDGASEETYKTYRVGGDFAKVLSNIRLINRVKRQKRSLCPKVILQFLIFKFNLHEVPEIRRLAGELGAELSLQQGCLSGPKYEPFAGAHSAELIERWIVRPEVFLSALGESSDSPGLFLDYYREGGPLSDDKCLFLWKTAYINWDGSVSPCCFVYKKDWDFGNIQQESFRRIWNNSKFQHARSLFRESSPHGKQDSTVCDSCRQYRKA